ncbi:PDZ domain (Also known as DHR or GLGF) [Rubripirellula amarantea]|uniref:PDZ domain (Also known as DHR or GLGF) n=1 Tax=Rubripirellula amarantea TaxID=2527999 RepID=A0A5C5WHQ1_9BACT|nr:PDZ domain-containing protein [Rubripirellula amarantea]TWT49615.1 PDZ domain (Also known as DHR or GLGF) [Rubripirellula amarantea]
MLKRHHAIQLCSLLTFVVLNVVGSQRLCAQPVGEPEVKAEFVEPKIRHVPRLGEWYLGVYGNYTSTGLQLTQVYPRTAASAVGLEVGDRIVAVNGQRISMRYPLDIALQSTRNGWVRLLVQDHRTNRLLNVNVRLTRVHRHF